MTAVNDRHTVPEAGPRQEAGWTRASGKLGDVYYRRRVQEGSHRRTSRDSNPMTRAERATPPGQQPAPAADGAALARMDNGGSDIAIVTPLCFGTTLAGLAASYGQRAFLDAIGAGYQLVAYDQRGAGASAAAGISTSWEQRGADLWALADAAGIERAVLYGVFDAGFTIASAAAQQPERVLGLIFNIVPPSFAATPDFPFGFPADKLDVWLNGPDHTAQSRATFVLRALGIGASDTDALAGEWARSESVQGFEQYKLLLRSADLRPLGRQLSMRTLVIEPQRRPLVAGWGRALGSLFPAARVIAPRHAGEMLGGIHGFLATIDIEEGRHASRLSPALSNAAGAAERSVTSLRRIVVPVVESVGSERAVEMACRLGALQQAEIVLVHVIELPLIRALDSVTDEERARGGKALALGEAIIARHGMHSRTRLLVERAASSGIVRAAAEEQVDVIVMAMGERRALVPGEMGRTVREVLRRAPCEVLIARGQEVLV